MAVKPQPLHNFPLSLKWGHQTTSFSSSSSHHHHNHRTGSPTTTTTTPDSETESDHEPTTRRVGSRSARVHRFNFTSCSKLLLKPKKSTPPPPPVNHTTVVEITEKLRKQLTVSEAEQATEEEAEEEKEERRWKLRPRKAILNNAGESAAASVSDQRERVENSMNQQQPKSMRLRGLAPEANPGGGGGGNGSAGAAEKKEKRKFWIALAREEIEEDIFILTGSRPARRPKKRPKNVQKVLDSVFPGLWLVGTTADSYRIAEASVKK